MTTEIRNGLGESLTNNQTQTHSHRHSRVAHDPAYQTTAESCFQCGHELPCECEHSAGRSDER